MTTSIGIVSSIGTRLGVGQHHYAVAETQASEV
jgi:hypothetical protein